MTHDEHAQDSVSYSSIATLVRQATGTWVNDRSGISTSGVNGTFLYSANGSMTSAESGNSSGCYTLHEEGTYANGTWNLGCMRLDESGQWNSACSYSGHDSASNTTGFSIAGSFSGAGSDAGSKSLHEEGTYANGSWNLGSYAETGNELWSDQSEYDESQSDGTYASTSTQTSSDQGTYSLYRTGTYGNGSYSFGCMVLDYATSQTDERTESGDNAVYSDYTRDDKDEYSYAYHQTASGSYTQSGVETITRDFDATLRAGGSIHNHSVIPLSFTTSGNRSVASGDLFVPNGEGSRPSGRFARTPNGAAIRHCFSSTIMYICQLSVQEES